MVTISLARRDGRPLAGGRARWLPLAAAAAALGIPLVAYLWTLAPGIYGPDGPELAAAAWTLGIPHAPGYPLYTLLGWLFTHALATGDVAWRLNVLSALTGSGASLAVFWLCRRLGATTWTALSASLLLAFSYYFWADSIAVEVYGLDALLLATTLLLLVSWDRAGDRRLLWAAAFAYGLALDGRTVLVLAAPALAWYAWRSPARPGLRDGALALGALALALSFYLYLPLRSASGPGYAWASTYADDGTAAPRDFATLPGLLWLVSARPLAWLVFYYGPLDAAREFLRWGGWLAASFLGVGVPLGLLGAWRQWKESRREFVLLAAVLLPLLVFFVNYGAGDKEFMFLPTYLIWAVWLALGLDWVWGKAQEASLPDGLPAQARAAGLLLPLLALVINLPLVTLRGYTETRDQAVVQLQQLPPQSVVVGEWEKVAPMQYLQRVEGMRPDVRLVQRWAVDDQDLARLAAASVGVRPLYIQSPEPALAARYSQTVESGNGSSGWYQVRAR